MDKLLARLTNLSYDFFGIFLPGLIFSMFIFLWLGALGPVLTTIGIPELSVSLLLGWAKELKDQEEAKIILVALLLLFWYFLGHLLHWVARSGPKLPGRIGGWVRLHRSLVFRIPKPQDSYDSKLEPLLAAIKEKFSGGTTDLQWGQLFPVLKVYLAQRMAHSLVPTYQIKYTLHRSLTAASVVLFWLSSAGILGAFVIGRYFPVSPHWLFLFALLSCSVASTLGFSGSYLYNWQLFGNTIITESYSEIYAPRDPKTAKSESSDN